MTPLCLQIEPFQLGQYRDDLDALEARFTNFWAGVTAPVRLISRTRRWSLAPIQQQIRAQLGPLEDLRDLLRLLEAARGDAGAIPALSDHLRRRQAAVERATAALPDAAQIHAALAALAQGDTTSERLAVLWDACLRAAWRWRWLTNYRRMYHTIEDQAPPLAIEHYVLTWPEAHVHAQALASTLKHTFLVPGVTPMPLPALFRGRYREEADYLHPRDPGYPYLTVLTGWDVRGEWDLWSLAPLLMDEHVLTLAIDIHTLPRGTALRKATDAHTVLQEAVYGRFAVKDARSERALGAVNYALQHLDVQALHEVAYALLLEAPTLPALNRQVQIMRDLLGVRLRLDRVVGAQAEYLKLFTPVPSHAIALPLVRRNTLSHGIAVTTPWGLRKTTRTSGTLWGYDVDEGMPIHYDPFGQTGVENAHLLMVGRAGSGKTVTLLTLALRAAVAGTQVVHFDPIGKGHLLTEAVGAGAAYYDVATDAAINILDPASDQLDRQIAIVTAKLSLLLGQVAHSGGRIRFTPRPFSNVEKGALDLALQTEHLYGRDGHRLERMTATNAPLLEVLVSALHAVATAHTLPEATELAREIELALLGSRAHLFNHPTTLRWDFTSQVVSYNFRDADPSLLPLYYAHGFDALNRWVRSPERAQRGQPLIVIIDEYFYMASVKELEAEVALATKTWRNYRAAMWTADQNATTYFGQAGLPAEWGPFTANNALIKLFFRQEASEAEVLGTAYRDHLHPSHVQAIKTAGTGECIALLGDEVHHLQVHLTDLETAYVLQTTTS
jgi:hypothetical protein